MKLNIKVMLEKTQIDHARNMYLHASNLRMKNFNFFLVVLGGIIAVYSSDSTQLLKIITSTVGILLGSLFYILDIRGKILLITAADALSKVEKKLEMNIVDQRNLSTSKIISHTFVYRLIYILSIVLSVVGLII